MEFSTHANGNGTSLQGYITIEKHYLERFFGPSEGGSGDGKVIDEWCLLVTDDAGDSDIITIYDWKNYDLTELPDDYSVWHVGGHSRAAVAVLGELLTQLSGRVGISQTLKLEAI